MKYDADVISKNIKRNQKIKKIISILFYLMLIPAILFSLLLILLELGNSYELPSFLKFEMYIVTTDSMEPRINVGDIIIVKNESDGSKYKKGNIITFQRYDGEIITHRIEEIDIKDGDYVFTTKGDNTTQSDKEHIKLGRVIGKVVNTLPRFGKIVALLKNKFVFAFLVIFLLLFLKYDEYSKGKIEKRKEDRKKHEKESRFHI